MVPHPADGVTFYEVLTILRRRIVNTLRIPQGPYKIPS